MQKIIDTFSNRELALIIWLMVILFAMTLNKSIRGSLIGVLKAFFAKQLFVIFSMLMLYISATILFLNYFGLWDKSLLKDTGFWFFSVALILFFNLNKAKDTEYFKSVAKDTFKWTIMIEFLVNFYTFSLLTELILLPILILIAITQAFSQTEKKYESVNKALTNILAVIGVSFFLFALYKTILSYQEVFTVHTLEELLLPAVLTTLFLPFIYFIALYMNYETLFLRVRFMINDNKLKTTLKREILFAANLNLNKLKIISDNLNKFDLYHIDEVKAYIRSLNGQKNGR